VPHAGLEMWSVRLCLIPAARIPKDEGASAPLPTARLNGGSPFLPSYGASVTRRQRFQSNGGTCGDGTRVGQICGRVSRSTATATVIFVSLVHQWVVAEPKCGHRGPRGGVYACPMHLLTPFRFGAGDCRGTHHALVPLFPRAGAVFVDVGSGR
jgi:hypothetical protein